MLNLTVIQKRVGPVLGRHPWVFSGALKSIPDCIASGAPVRLVDEGNNFLASGYFNSYSQIAVRVWGWQDGEEVDEDFFVRRISSAYDLRQRLVLSKMQFRVLFAIPGLEQKRLELSVVSVPSYVELSMHLCLSL